MYSVKINVIRISSAASQTNLTHIHGQTIMLSFYALKFTQWKIKAELLHPCSIFRSPGVQPLNPVILIQVSRGVPQFLP